MSKEKLEKKNFCVDCGAEIARNGKHAKQRYLCSICGADYRNKGKTTISRLTKQLNDSQTDVVKFDEKIKKLTEKRVILEEKIAVLNGAIEGFTNMVEIIKNSEPSSYDSNLVINTREQIKAALKRKG
jgi:transposase-like protein